MRRDVVLLLAATVLLALLVVPVQSVSAPGSDDGETPEEPEEPVDPEPTEYTVYGYVSNISDEEMNVPLSGVGVSLIDADGNVLATDTTDALGMFEFTYPADSGASMLRFDIPGYMVRTLPGTMQQDDPSDKNLVSFSIDGIVADADGRYALSGDGQSTSAVGMALTNGNIYGIVVSSETGEGLEGATVVAMNSAGRQYSTTTDEDGYFEMSLPYDTYSVSVSCSGFGSSTPVDTDTSLESGLTIELVPNKFGIDLLGGIDMPHALLIIGLALIGVILLFTLLLMRESRRNPDSGLTVVNDLSKFEDDDEIERP